MTPPLGIIFGKVYFPIEKKPLIFQPLIQFVVHLWQMLLLTIVIILPLLSKFAYKKIFSFFISFVTTLYLNYIIFLLHLHYTYITFW